MLHLNALHLKLKLYSTETATKLMLLTMDYHPLTKGQILLKYKILNIAPQSGL